VTLVSSEFSTPNNVLRHSHAVPGLWLWIAVVDVVCHVWAWAYSLWGSNWYETFHTIHTWYSLSGT
jgi:hypothetical protein